jgi:hypothetical protein
MSYPDSPGASSPTDSFAGITVPDGDPGSIRDAAATFRRAAHGLQGIASDVRAVPGLVGDWRGPASARYHHTTVTNGSAVDAAVEALGTCEQAATTYAGELERCQNEARKAIADARDAQSRIDTANAAIATARDNQRSAYNGIDSANHTIATHAAAGSPAPHAQEALNQAQSALSAAQGAESSANRQLSQAEDDLAAAQKRGEQAETDAITAAHVAAGAFQGVAGGSPIAAVFGGSPEAVGEQILARVRAGDFTALDGVPLNYLPPRIQKAIGGSLADQAYKLSTDPEHHDRFMALTNELGKHTDDPDLATGFYNHLGGLKANQLAHSIGLFQTPGGHGWDYGPVQDTWHPYSALLATATAGGKLRSDFEDGFFGPADEVGDRLGDHPWMTAFIMSGGAASTYGSKFLSRAGKEVLVDPHDPFNNPNSGPLNETNDEFASYISGNPEAAGLIVAGTDGHGMSNASTLMRVAVNSGGDATGLGDLIRAGTHDLRGTDMTLANDAAHKVIQVTPTYGDHLPDGLHDSLTTVLDDHIRDFEYAATQNGAGGDWPAPSDGINGLSYDEAHNYLKTLLGDDGMRHDASSIVGNRVAEDLYNGVANGSEQDLVNGGSLSQMGVMATADADMSAAHRADAMNGMAQSAGGKLVGLLPTSRVPGGAFITDKVASAAFGEIFPTDHVNDAWDAREGLQADSYGHIKKLITDAQVATGQMPSAVSDIVRADGTIDLSHAQDVVQVNGHDLQFDLNHDGRITGDEQHITNEQLAHAAASDSGLTYEAANALHSNVYNAHHLPKVDDLPLPDGYSQDNPGFPENMAPWHTGGENGFNGPGGITYDDVSMQYDASHHVLNVTAQGDGHTAQLHYVSQDGKWKLAQWDGHEWRPTS